MIESLVARTQRLVESTQSLVRLVGLSATLPNYGDVALFLRVNAERGLFHFGPEWRPTPLKQTFIGVKEKGRLRQHAVMDEITYEVRHHERACPKHELTDSPFPFPHDSVCEMPCAPATRRVSCRRGQERSRLSDLCVLYCAIAGHGFCTHAP